MSLQDIKGDWNIVRGKLKQKIALLTEDERQFADGKQAELTGRIQKRTGKKFPKPSGNADECSCCNCR